MKYRPWQSLRFGLRKCLRLLPRRAHVRVGPEAQRIGVLFAGTYGDFVQLLPMLHEAERLWPKAHMVVWAPRRLVDAFAFALPVRIRRGNLWDMVAGLLFPMDLVLMNAVCVYRLRYEWLSLRLGRAAAGFRYADEPFRVGLGWSVPLTSDVVNFAEANYELPKAVAAAKLPSSHQLPWRARIDPTVPFPFEGPILFSVGSAGFKQRVGISAYVQLIDGILALLPEAKVTFVAGPDDADVVAHLLANHPEKACWQISIEQLGVKMAEWPGCILGFNSFMAHFALYLGRRMVVFHLEKVPHGYDCSPFHKQVVLSTATGLDLGEFQEFLMESKRSQGRQELPGRDRGR
jgi:hypothetical protein